MDVNKKPSRQATNKMVDILIRIQPEGNIDREVDREDCTRKKKKNRHSDGEVDRKTNRKIGEQTQHGGGFTYK